MMPVPFGIFMKDASGFFSKDFYIRLAPKMLPRLQAQLQHVLTETDPSVLADARKTYALGPQGLSAGFTEWACDLDGHAVSLGWDWLRQHDGQIVCLTLAPPRSNLMLLDAAGYDPDFAHNTAALWRLIQGLHWTGHVEQQLRHT